MPNRGLKTTPGKDIVCKDTLELSEMITPLLTLSPEAIEEDGVFRHPYLLRCDFALVADQDPFPIPHFVVCHTPLPAYFCTCGRYALFEEESEEPWY
jgi:hypothetical protein